MATISNKSKDYTIEIDTQNLGNDLIYMESNVNRIKDELKDIHTLIGSLNTMWTGPAHDRFVETFNSKKTNFTKDIEKYIKSLENCKTRYEECVTKAQEKISALK